jgi:hypothetical protein
MIALDLVGDDALVRGDTYQHVFEFRDPATQASLDMEANGATYACHFRSRDNTLGITAVATVNGGQITVEATVPASLPTSKIGSSLWRWDLERTEPPGLVTTILGGKAQIKVDATNSPGPV